jgi:hypothetical protein
MIVGYSAGWGQQNVVLKGAYLLATLRCWLLSSLQRLEKPRLADRFRRVERSLDTGVGVLPSVCSHRDLAVREVRHSSVRACLMAHRVTAPTL